jgi:hypothetical protein
MPLIMAIHVTSSVQSYVGTLEVLDAAHRFFHRAFEIAVF